MTEYHEIPGLGQVIVLDDTDYWGIRMPDGTVPELYTSVEMMRGRFQEHLIAASRCGLRTEFLTGAQVVRHRRLLVATAWEDDAEATKLMAEMFPLVEQQPEDGDGW